jgi:hypothetical protein
MGLSDKDITRWGIPAKEEHVRLTRKKEGKKETKKKKARKK